MVAIGADYDCSIEYIINGVLQKSQREVDVSFLFFMTFPSGSALVTACGLLTKSSHVTFNTAIFKRRYVLAMARVGVSPPSGIGRKICDLNERLTVQASSRRNKQRNRRYDQIRSKSD